MSAIEYNKNTDIRSSRCK